MPDIWSWKQIISLCWPFTKKHSPQRPSACKGCYCAYRDTTLTEYVAGSKLILADSLSRAPEPHSGKSDELAALAEEQQSDLQLVASQQTINELRAAGLSAFEATNRCRLAANESGSATGAANVFHILWRTSCQWWFRFQGPPLIPVGYREQILARLHSSHIGVNSCIRRTQKTCYFPGITAEIKRLISAGLVEPASCVKSVCLFPAYLHNARFYGTYIFNEWS